MYYKTLKDAEKTLQPNKANQVNCIATIYFQLNTLPHLSSKNELPCSFYYFNSPPQKPRKEKLDLKEKHEKELFFLSQVRKKKLEERCPSTEAHPLRGFTLVSDRGRGQKDVKYPLRGT